MADIFISYSRRDFDFAEKLVNALNADGRTVWIDRKIRAGAQFPDEIRNELDAAAAVIFIISPDSVESDWCRRELAYASENHKRIIPLLYRPLEDLSRLPSEVAQVQWIAFADEEKQFSKAFATLQHALDTDLDAERQGALLLVRARTWEAQNRQVGLLTGNELDEAERWLVKAAATNVAPTELHVRYITSSRGRQTIRQRRAITGLSLGLAILLILTTVSLVLLQTVRARDVQITDQRDAALLALEANNASANGQIDLALLLGAQANRLDDSLLTRDALVGPLSAYPALRTVVHPALPSLEDGALSHDGTTLAMISSDTTGHEKQLQLVSVSNLSHIVVSAPILLPQSDPAFPIGLAFTPDDSDIIVMVSQTHMVAVSTAHFGAAALERAFALPNPTWGFHSLLAVSTSRVYALLCSITPDGNGGTNCGPQNSVFMWNIADGSPRGTFAPLASAISTAFFVAESPNGQTLVIGTFGCGGNSFFCASFQMQAWSLANASKIGEPIVIPLDSSTWVVPTFVFSPDGSYGLFYTNCWDSNHPIVGCNGLPSNWQSHAQLFRLTAQGVQAASALTEFADQSAVVGATILPGATRRVVFEETAIGSDLHGRISQWDPSATTIQAQIPSGVVADHLVGEVGDGVLYHSSPTPSMPLLASADGTTLFVPYGTNSLLVWDLTGNSSNIYQRLAGVGPGNAVLAQRLDTGAVLWRDAKHQTILSINSADISTELLWNGQVAEIWRNGPATHTLLGDLPDAKPPGTLELSANGRYAAEIDPVHADIRLWDVGLRTLLATMIVNGQPFWPSPGVFSPTNDLFVYPQGAEGEDLVGWDLRTHTVRFHAHGGGDSSIVDLAFAADGHTVASVDGSGAVWLWDATHGTRLRELQDTITPALHSLTPNQVVFSGDGHLLASRNSSTVTLWDVASAAPLFHIQVPDTISSLQFDPAGTSLILVTTSEANDNSVLAYRVPITPAAWQTIACQEAGRTFTRAEWQQYLPERPYAPVCPGTP